MIRVMITDDHAIIRDGLHQIVRESGDVMVAAEAGTAAETLDRLRDTSVDVLVLDLNLPDRHGIDLMQHLRVLYPRLPILILSTHGDPSYAVRLMKAGAAGYIGKDAARGQLVEGIRKVASGAKYIASGLAETVALHVVGRPGCEPHETLSDREFHILLLLAAGRPPRDIANELNLSPRTIGSHRANILLKIGVRTNAELATYVQSHGLMA